MTGPVFKKAERKAAKLKINVQGPSGSGKTMGALALAKGLAPTGKIAVIDAENGSASLYADDYAFDTLDIRPPYLTKKYMAAIRAAIDAGYEVIVIDSISHQWDGEGGILQRKDEADARPGSNHWTNWGPFTKEHNEFRALLLSAPVHIITTMRSKMAYTQSEANGKKKVEKLGLQPIQRDGMEYEFTLSFDVGMDHRAQVSKNRTPLFKEESVDLLDAEVPASLLGWLGTAPSPAPAPETESEDGAPLAGDVRVKWLVEKAKAKGMSEDQFRDLMAEVCGVTSSKKILAAHVEEFGAAIDRWTKPAAAVS